MATGTDGWNCRWDTNHMIIMQKIKYIILYLALSATAASAQDLLQPAAWDGYYNIACREKLVDYNSDAFYMCRPSFTPEYALSIVNGRYSSQSKLVLKRATENLWYNDNYPRRNGKRPKRDKWDKHHKYHDVAVESYILEVKADACSLIYNLVKAANETATYFNGEKSGCDGVTYYFHSWGRYGRTWSPNKNCRTGRLVAAMDSICHAVELGDTAMFSRQLPSCRTLLGEFRNAYPLTAFMPDVYWVQKINDFGVHYREYDPNDTTTIDNLDFSMWNGIWSLPHIRLLLPQPQRMQDTKYIVATMSDRIARFSRQRFLLYDLHNVLFEILIENEQPEEYFCKMKGYAYIRLSDTIDFESKCLSAPLDKEGLFRRGPDGTWQQADTAGVVKWWKTF